MTPETLQQICLISHDKAYTWAPPLTEAMQRFELTTKLRTAAFIAHVMRDTDCFERLQLDLRGLTARRICALWPDVFQSFDVAAQFTGTGVALCNMVFANCAGNGGFESGDGHRYRPRGLLYLCGRWVYERASLALGHDFIDDPDALCLPRWAALSAGWYWHEENFNYFADKKNVDTITDILDRRNLMHGVPDHRATRVAFHEALNVLN